MTIVSNASPLISLARIGQLDLLRQLYGALTIPEAVWQETVVKGVRQAGAEEIRAAQWINRQTVTDQRLVYSLRQELDAGEAEAIALAIEQDAELLLMDERLGRETAHYFGVRYIGLLGVLVEAKHKGLIGAVKPLVDALREIAGFRIAEALYEEVIRDEGEI